MGLGGVWRRRIVTRMRLRIIRVSLRLSVEEGSGNLSGGVFGSFGAMVDCFWFGSAVMSHASISL